MTGEPRVGEPSYAEIAVADLREQFQQFYISDEVIGQVKAAGCRIGGVRYFGDLFSSDPNMTLEERLTSAYVGATAHGYESGRKRSYHALYGMQTVPSVNELFIQGIDKAIKEERRDPTPIHVTRLEKATKELGKSPLKRFLGGLATDFRRGTRSPVWEL